MDNGISTQGNVEYFVVILSRQKFGGGGGGKSDENLVELPTTAHNITWLGTNNY